MRVAVLAHLRYPIAAPFMGGMESHCHQLVRSLVKCGHDVTLFASDDSDPALPLSGILPRHYEATLPWAQWHGSSQLADLLESALSLAWASIIQDGKFDIVHNNSLHSGPHAWAVRDRQPMVTSLHVPPFQTLAAAVAENAAPWLRQTATSRSHMASWWRAQPSSAAVVYNGVDASLWPFRASGNGRAVWCGRITPNKGTAEALDAARALDMELDVIGPIDCMDYFEQEVGPRLDGRRLYRGQMSGPELARAIGAASVFLATPMWDEPFGLTAAEALACGVPVAALDRGAMREVVADCGALAADPAGLPAAIAAALQIERARCRAHVARELSVEAMVGGYERAYAEAIAGRSSSSLSTAAELA